MVNNVGIRVSDEKILLRNKWTKKEFVILKEDFVNWEIVWTKKNIFFGSVVKTTWEISGLKNYFTQKQYQ